MCLDRQVSKVGFTKASREGGEYDVNTTTSALLGIGREGADNIGCICVLTRIMYKKVDAKTLAMMLSRKALIRF